MFLLYRDERQRKTQRERETDVFFTGDHCAYCNYAMIALCFSVHNSFMDGSIENKNAAK